MTTTAPWWRSQRLMNPTDTVLLVVDVQERLFGHIAQGEVLEQKLDLLLRAAQLMSIPIVGTEQYPRGLGSTIASLQPWMDEPIEKLTFSCWGSDAVRKKLELRSSKNVVVAGIETHVCVQQTVYDLLDAGFSVFLPVDGLGSRQSPDHQWAVQRMTQAGAVASTVESMVFEWKHVAGDAQFKALSQLIKESEAAVSAHH